MDLPLPFPRPLPLPPRRTLRSQTAETFTIRPPLHPHTSQLELAMEAAVSYFPSFRDPLLRYANTKVHSKIDYPFKMSQFLLSRPLTWKASFRWFPLSTASLRASTTTCPRIFPSIRGGSRQHLQPKSANFPFQPQQPQPQTSTTDQKCPKSRP